MLVGSGHSSCCIFYSSWGSKLETIQVVKMKCRNLHPSKALYHQIHPLNFGTYFRWKKSWNLSIPSKVGFFTWRALLGWLNTRESLHKFFYLIPPTCPLYGDDLEILPTSFVNAPSLALSGFVSLVTFPLSLIINWTSGSGVLSLLCVTQL